MTNAFYNASGNPANRAPGSSAAIRAEFQLVQDGFDKFPTFAGNANRVLMVSPTEDGFAFLQTLDDVAVGTNTPRAGRFTTLAAASMSLDSDLIPWFSMKAGLAAANYGVFKTVAGAPLAYMGGGAGAAVAFGSASDFALRAVAGKLHLSATGSLDFTVSSVNGRIGIGNASPTTTLDILAATGDVGGRLVAGSGTGAAYWLMSNTGGDLYLARDSAAGNISGLSYAAALWSVGAGALAFGVSGAYRAQISAAGQFGVNTTAFAGSNQNGFTVEPYVGGIICYVGHNGGAANGEAYAVFQRNGTTLGSITQVSSTGVAYNVTSDRRLKERIEPALDPGDLIDALEVVRHGWIGDPDRHTPYGFIAQDLNEVAPYVVTPGDMDENEVTRPWQVDLTGLIPMLVLEQQRLRARVRSLEAA